MSTAIDEMEAKEQALEIIEECRGNMMLFAKVIFPHAFDFPFGDLHKTIFKYLMDDSIRKLLIVAPRGSGKTTVVQLAYAAYEILFNKRKLIVTISKSNPHALNQSERLKMELVSNTMIGKIWGNLRSEMFTKDQWKVGNRIGTIVLPRGSEQQIRGALIEGQRPDLIIGDDIEDLLELESEVQRAKIKLRFYDDVMNSVDYKKDNWRIVLIGSMLHQDSLLANIEEQAKEDIEAGREPEWTVVNVPLCGSNFKSNWPEAFSDEWISKKLREYKRAGLLDSFAREFMGVAVSPQANFTKRMFKHYREAELPAGKRENLKSFILIDPSKTVSEKSCETALVCVGVDVRAWEYYVRDIVTGVMDPDEVIDYAFAMSARWGTKLVGVEVTSLHLWVLHMFRNEMISRRVMLHLEELHATGGNKVERSKPLLNYYKRGQVYHEESIANLIEIPLLSWPKPKKWDVIDSLAYFPVMLSQINVFFMPKGYDSQPSDSESDALARMREEDKKMGPPPQVDRELWKTFVGSDS